jgi:GxxExxY protein
MQSIDDLTEYHRADIGVCHGQFLLEETLTRSAIGAFFEVYNSLGFGFLEHLYVMALERELLARGHRVAREVGILVKYKGDELGTQRLDMVIDEKLVIETKSTFDLHKAARRQLYSYLKATSLEVGPLLHFGPEPHFHRVVCKNSNADPADQSPSSESVHPSS